MKTTTVVNIVEKEKSRKRKKKRSQIVLSRDHFSIIFTGKRKNGCERLPKEQFIRPNLPQKSIDIVINIGQFDLRTIFLQINPYD